MIDVREADENTNGLDDQSALVRILLNLYFTEDINEIIEIITNNLDKFTDIENKDYEELIFVLFNVLNKQQINNLSEDFSNSYDNRLMPSVFIVENIKNSISEKDDIKLLLYSIISLNNKEWREVHPTYLEMILKVFKL